MAQHSTIHTTTNNEKKEDELACGMLANLNDTASDAQGMPITNNNLPKTHRECPSSPTITNKEDAPTTNVKPSRITPKNKNKTKDHSDTPITPR